MGLNELPEDIIRYIHSYLSPQIVSQRCRIVNSIIVNKYTASIFVKNLYVDFGVNPLIMSTLFLPYLEKLYVKDLENPQIWISNIPKDKLILENCENIDLDHFKSTKKIIVK